MSDETTTPGDCPIETAIPEGHVIFLLGAGASKDDGFPLVDELTCKMRKRLCKWLGTEQQQGRARDDPGSI